MDGFLCIDKPNGATSRDVVNQIQKLVRPTKVGHAGTLDPLATGVLVIAIGRATRLVPYVQRMNKTYEAGFLLGKTSDTEDVTGNLVQCELAAPPSAAEVANVCERFVGETLQKPPAFSALKVKGRRSYQLARAGQSVELQPRPIMIYGISVTHYEFPQLRIEVECGSGTYIRSLGRDIGDALGCGAVMSDLRRTRIGGFGIEDAVLAATIDSVAAVQRALRPAVHGVAALGQINLAEWQCRALSYGQKLRLPGNVEPELAALDPAGRLAAVLRRAPDGIYRPSINFVAQ